MTRDLNTINPAERLYDLAALHCVELSAEGSDRDRALAAAADCFHLANWWPGEADVAEQFLALAEALPDDAQSASDNCPNHSPPISQQLLRNPPPPRSDEFVRPSPPPTSDEFVRSPPPPTSQQLLRSPGRPRPPRRPSIRKLIEQAEKAGKPVTSVTMPDGTKLDFSKPESAASENPWFDDLKVTKQ